MYDELFDALAHERRRELLHSLAEHDAQTELSAVDELHEETLDEDALRIELIHTHLPKLDDYGLIIWNQANHRVMRGVNFERIRPIVEAIPDESESR